MSEQELIALVQLLNRASLSQAERLWIQALIERELQRAREAKG